MRKIFDAFVIGVLTIGCIGLATPAAAEPEAAAVDVPPVAMPDITGMDLQQARDAFISAAVGTDRTLDVSDIRPVSGQKLSLPNWVVCWQAPSAGEDIVSAEWIGVGVSRMGESCW